MHYQINSIMTDTSDLSENLVVGTAQDKTMFNKKWHIVGHNNIGTQ